MNWLRPLISIGRLRVVIQARGSPWGLHLHHQHHGVVNGVAFTREGGRKSQREQCRWHSSAPPSILAMRSPVAVDFSASMIEDDSSLDPFALVADELDLLANRMREMVRAEVPKLATAAEYFFKLGAEGKRFRPTVLLLMASSLNLKMFPSPDSLGAERNSSLQSLSSSLSSLPFSSSSSSPPGPSSSSVDDQRCRQQRLAEITEMIHVASLLHDDVLDHANTRRGVGSLNYVMGNKLAVLAGDFLLARASVALASLRNVEVIELLSRVLEHLVTGETMQMTVDSRDCGSMDYYMKKTFFKTASLMANSCKAIAILGEQPAPIASLAYDYGHHLGLAFQLVDDVLDFTGSSMALGKPALNDLSQGIATAPVLFAAEEFTGMYDLIWRRFKRQGDIEQALEWVLQSNGIERAKQLALQHSLAAVAALKQLPHSESEHVLISRRALVTLAQRVLTRSK